MDELQRSIYVDRVRLAGHAFGTDFEEVRPYDPYGDRKCDGRGVSTKSVFQGYGPDAMKCKSMDLI